MYNYYYKHLAAGARRPPTPLRPPASTLNAPRRAAPVQDDGRGIGRPPRSNWWFALPILFSIFGGLVAYFAIRNDDRPKARNCLYLGLAMTALSVALNMALAAWFAGIVGGTDLTASP